MEILLNYLKAFILFFISKKIKNKLTLIKENENKLRQPYIINVVNNGEMSEKKVEILGSYEYLYKGFTDSGSLAIGSIEISSGMPNVKYREMLYQFMIDLPIIGLTYIQSITEKQVLEPIYINKKNSNGNISQKQLNPINNEESIQKTISVVKETYSIDGYTKIIIEKIAPRTYITFQFYPIIPEIKLSRFEKFINWLLKR
jgi:hypothetical protein